ncbi:MAG: glycosyltransferase [Lewinellaceae bacterium]|nr:glycosyltransferase [Lewinella sp.]MCB9278340.1 glycosyltransferase [Lewinellaceae bacterium]
MKLSVVIVSYNVKYFLEQALNSVRKASEGLAVETWVVDNNSADGSANLVREKFPWVRLIANDDNPGFARANNQAIRQASGEFILLLNPDTIVAEDTFSKCLSFMDRHPEAGGLGVHMLDGSGQFLPESRRGFPTPWVAFCKTAGLSRLFPRSKWFNTYYLGYLPMDEPHEADILSGAFMLMRSEALAKSGLLDESFFMYGEDIDLSYRLIQAGYQNYFLPDVKIIHFKGESTKKGTLNYVRIFYQAMIIFAQKHFRGERARLFVLMLQTAVYLRAVITVIGNFFRRARLPILDALLIFAGLVTLKQFWANYHFHNPDYYDDLVTYFNFPLYTAIWILSVFFSGGYDRETNIRRVVRGIFLGTVLSAAVYGFLGLAYRPSRALLILGAGWALVSMTAIRSLLHFTAYGSFYPERAAASSMAVAGSEAEAARVLKLLQDTGLKRRYTGRIAPEADPDGDKVIGHFDNLERVTALFRIRELIFCMQDTGHSRVIEWMSRLGPGIKYRMIAEGSQTVVGSSSKNAAGQLYTLETPFAIAFPENRRNKRVVDVLTALLVLLTFPLQWIWVRNRSGLIKHGWEVLRGRKTWVGYHAPPEKGQLPELKPGVISPSTFWAETGISAVNARQLDRLYARNYTPLNDLSIIFKNRKSLGG